MYICCRVFSEIYLLGQLSAFPVPDPIINYKMSLTENPIEEVAVPEMIIKLKQGIGRLIRCATLNNIIIKNFIKLN